MDVLCVGHAAWDISALVDDYPAEDSKCETRALLECGGGPAANAAWLLSSWGVACALAATVGRDAYADRVIEEFVRAGTDVSLVHRSPVDPTPVSVILASERTASRTIVNRKAAAAASPVRIAARPPWAEAPKVLLFDGHEPDASLEAMALYPDARTILDAGSARPGAVELARRVEHLVASERFAVQLGGVPDLDAAPRRAAAMRKLYEHNGRPVVITLGERGLLWGAGERFQHMPAFKVKSVDTTAAGDVFHGAFAYGVLKEMPIEATLRLAAAAAALSTTAHGGRTSIPPLVQVQEFLAHAE
jgi:sugar/nucleoside kinase (ribokinase family)